MTLDFTKETKLHAFEAMQHPLLSSRSGKSTYSRWSQLTKTGVVGLDGKRHTLEYVKLTDGSYTTESAIKRFIGRLNGNTDDAVASMPPVGETDSAMRELAAAGLA
ncbi:MAG: hypothetical protein QM754_10750 [Tepidisphaeraceae bacterium]